MSPRPPKRGKRSGAGDGSPPPHPLARAIEQLYAAGQTPRLVLDARRADVIVPDFVRTKWESQLVIDLDASYPLDLVYDVDGVHASLAFQGVVTRCTFSWASIYRVLERASGRGIVVPAHEPEAELPPELRYEGGSPVTEIVDARATPKAGLSVAPAPAAPLSVAPPASPSAPETAKGTSDEEAKARRAKFRVIEGG
jgi:stringent starvation protein B